MTALPLQPPRLLTVAEFAALPENGDVGYELQEGALVMSSGPLPEHQRCMRRLLRLVEDQLPEGLEVLPDVDVDAPAVSGVFAVEEPFRVRLELPRLLRSPGQR
jgi:Uma2 family endonuclease